jgi:hypothetical protein
MFKYLCMGVLCCQGLLGATPDKELVEKRLQDFTAALNQDQEDLFASFWTEDGEFSKPLTGEVLEGKATIIPFLQARAKEIHTRQLTFSFNPAKFDFPTPDEAVVEGVSEISGKEGLLQRNARRVELVKDQGQWLIDTVSDIEVAPAPRLYEHLKGLEWLIGKWLDKDDNSTITFTTDWDKFKNFIVQRFKMEVYGVEELEGLQIIGWDPIEQRIRSWVYDSDGGFGSGVWTQNGNSWTAVMNYVLSDGKKASATYTYTQEKDKSYNFSATNRTLNGEAVPDIAPVTVLKENS